MHVLDTEQKLNLTPTEVDELCNGRYKGEKTEEVVDFLIDMLATNSPQLRVLHLVDFPLGDRKIAQIADAFRDNTYCEYLNLYGTGMTPAVSEKLATALASKSMAKITIGGNALGDEGVKPFLEKAGLRQTSWIGLDICETGITEESLHRILHISSSTRLLTVGIHEPEFIYEKADYVKFIVNRYNEKRKKVSSNFRANARMKMAQR